MVLHENAEIRVECSSWDDITITNKRSGASTVVAVAGNSLAIIPNESLGWELKQMKSNDGNKAIVLFAGPGR